MSANSNIEWCDATWNPVRGCSRVSEGCMNCYAERQAHRFSGTGQPYDGLTKSASHGPAWTGRVRLVPELLDQPLRWRKPRRIFVNSMSDLFHEDVSTEFIGSVMGIAATADWHTFQVLTKRPRRMVMITRDGRFLDAYEDTMAMYTYSDPLWPPLNVWLGVSVEHQAAADERIPLLLQTPAEVRYISCEPLLAPIDLSPWLRDGVPSDAQIDGPHGARYLRHGAPQIDWVIVGGESGPGARVCNVDWVYDIVRQCREVGVPVFVKQLGSKVSGRVVYDRKGANTYEWPAELRVREFPR